MIVTEMKRQTDLTETVLLSPEQKSLSAEIMKRRRVIKKTLIRYRRLSLRATRSREKVSS